MSTELVIAHYKEDYDWLKAFDFHFDSIFIYHKFKENNYSRENIKKIKMKNIGRESHTYINHIITNYDNLGDNIVFLTANPFQNSNDFDNKMVYYLNNSSKPEYFEFGQRDETCDAMGGPHHIGGLEVGKYYEKWLNKPFPGKITFKPGSLFATNSENIRKHSKKYWQELLEWHLVYDNAHSIMERLWQELLQN